MKTAIVAGATGLVGNHLLHQLLDDERYEKVVIFVRRKTGISYRKLVEHIVDFDKPQNWKDKVKGDVLFSAMGTTIKKAGSKAAQRKVDYSYQYEIAVAASQNGIRDYVLISSAGASPRSLIFYSRMKGELDRDVEKLDFQRVFILKPSVLTGNRQNRRAGEEIFSKILRRLQWIPGISKYRPIAGEDVARAMRSVIEKETQNRITEYTLDELFDLLK